MANETATIVLTADDWSQICDAGDSVLLTPTIPEGLFLIRYQELKPAPSIGVGHVYKKDDENQNLIVGGLSLDNGWMKPLFPTGVSVNVEKTVLD